MLGLCVGAGSRLIGGSLGGTEGAAEVRSVPSRGAGCEGDEVVGPSLSSGFVAAGGYPLRLERTFILRCCRPPCSCPQRRSSADISSATSADTVPTREPSVAWTAEESACDAQRLFKVPSDKRDTDVPKK